MKKFASCYILIFFIILGISCKHSDKKSTPPESTDESKKVLTQEEMQSPNDVIITDATIVEPIKETIKTQLPDATLVAVTNLGHSSIFGAKMSDNTYRIMKGIYGTLLPTAYSEIDVFVKEKYPSENYFSYALRVRRVDNGKWEVLDENLNTLVDSSKFERITKFKKLSEFGIPFVNDIYVAKAENASGSVEFIDIKGKNTDHYFSATSPDYQDYIIFAQNTASKECCIGPYLLNNKTNSDSIKIFDSCSALYRITLTSTGDSQVSESKYAVESCETISSWVNSFLKENSGIPRDVKLELVDKADVTAHYDY